MSRREKNREKKLKRRYTIFLLFFIIIFLISLYKIVEWKIFNDKNKKIRQEVSSAITIKNDENNQKEYNVDFASLKEKNPDTVAWIKVEGTDVEYPVVQYTNNDYYLKKNFNKEYNIAGWIFLDYRNKLDNTDKNIIVYGHNMKDNSMFGTLRNILEEEWLSKEERIVEFVTENEKQKYQVFSVYQIEAEDYYITTNFNKINFTDFLETIKKRSIKNFGVETKEDDTILTLSTCGKNNSYRIVLHAKKIIF